MSLNLTMHRQWASRPDDERFASLAAMAAKLEADDRSSGERPISFDQLKIQPSPNGNQDLQLVGPQGNPATFTHWSFRQLCGLAKAPAAYLQQLPADLASSALNYSLQQAERAQEHDRAKLYLQQLGQTDPATLAPAMRVRAVTGRDYTRVHTAQIVRRLEQQIAGQTWRAPEVYARGEFGANLEPCVGFAGDRDAYICLVDSDRTVTDPTDPSQELWRGIMVLNSEVGRRRLKWLFFLCQKVCANFMIWDYQEIASFDRVHTGTKIHDWTRELPQQMHTIRELPAATEQTTLDRAAGTELAKTKEKTISAVTTATRIPTATATAAYDAAEQWNQNPRSIWGFAHGLTRVSQATGYQDQRLELDRAAQKLIAQVAA